MPAPKPLTLCPAPQLDWSRPGTPAATDFGDIYFSTDGGLDETRTVFLEGCRLPDAWKSTERFVIGELGFGSGLNFLATWQMWEANKPENGHLHFVSVEKFPFDQKQLAQALSAWPELSDYTNQLLAIWPGRVRGFHRLHFGDVILTLIHDDIKNALNALEMKANAWFLDGFSPSKNPDMWSPEIMKQLADLSEKGARLATFTVAGDVRRALSSAGFVVERKTGFGRKRHRLEAYLEGEPPAFSYAMPPTPIVVGTGIGGLSFIEAFKRRRVTPQIIEDSQHIHASGNAAALIKPRLDLQDRPESRFFLSSYLYALSAYQNACLRTGITHIAKTDKDAQRHTKLCDQTPLPIEHLDLGNKNNLRFSSARVIDPLQYREDVLQNLSVQDSSLETLPNEGSLFIAAGFGVKSLLPDWPLRFSRGQLTWVNTHKTSNEAVSYGGYALPLTDKMLLGATHDRLAGHKNPFELRAEDDAKNIAQYETHIGGTVDMTRAPSRASIRVTSHDTLPVIGQSENGHFVLTGLGSRGFVFAPLLAEAIVSHFYGDPLPIDKAVWEIFSAKRLFS